MAGAFAPPILSRLPALLIEHGGLALALPFLLFVPGKSRFFFVVRVVNQRRLFVASARAESAEKRQRCDFQMDPLTNCCQHRRQYLPVAPELRGPKCS